VHFPGPELDHEEHVELLQGDGVHGEEVRGQDAIGLGTQELRPGRPLPRNGSESIAAQDPPDRGSRDPDPQLAQLSLDAHAAPPAVLPTEANDELHEFVAKRRPARSSLCSPPSPFPSGQFPVPTQEGVGGDEEAPPLRPRETTAESSEDRSVGGPVPDMSVDLPFEDSHLVSEHHDLDVLVRSAPLGRDDEAEEPAEPEVKEGEDHGG
jgi:hypothetical protein